MSRQGRTFRPPTSDTESETSQYEDAQSRTPESPVDDDTLSYSSLFFEPRTNPTPFTALVSDLLSFNQIPINTTMVNKESSNNQMDTDSRKNGTKELQINYPTKFDGNRENLENFLQDCHLYLGINNEIYNTDLKKIVFMLSFMKKGTTLTWKESWTQEKLATTTQDFGTIKSFIDELKKAFSAADTEGDARAKLRQLRQGKNSVDEYVAEFRILAGKAKMKDDKALTEYFMEGINTGILQKIFASETLPATIQEWYERASKHDAQYRRVHEILERQRGATSSSSNTNQTKKTFIPRYVPRYASTTRDPNAMDIKSQQPLIISPVMNENS